MPSNTPLADNRTRSQELWDAARRLLPGGVNSPVRAFRSVGGGCGEPELVPPFIRRGQGAEIWDVDGNRYLDYVGSWGPLILGHAHPEVVEAVQEAATSGLTYGAPSEGEVRLAELVTRLLPSIEVLRLVNSGTEATMSAIRLARAFTGRTKIVKFAGCYHGHADMFLVQAGSGVATLGLPDSPGVPAAVTADTLVAPFNDLAALETLFAELGDQMAAVIVEPVVGNAGVLPPVPGFLSGLRELTIRHGVLLVFDEVMTGFRVALGGAQARYGVRPDLTCLGKVVGGGMPVGAYGGRRDIMAMVAPSGPVYQAGTLSGNPMATAAGTATLRILEREGQPLFDRMEQATETLCQGLEAACREAGVTATVNRVGTMFTLFFGEGPIRDWPGASRCDRVRFARYFRAMLELGVYLPPSQFEAAFVGACHGPDTVARTLEAARTALAGL